MFSRRRTLWLVTLVLFLGCPAAAVSGEPLSGSSPAAPGPASIHPSQARTAAERLLEPSAAGWQEMLDDRLIRVLVVYNRTHFFLDQARQRGIIADSLHELEKHLNRELRLGARQLHVVPIPVRRDQLIPFLEQGRGDMAAANLTITPERLARVDFSIPTSKPIDEVVVTGPGAPPLASLADLAGKTIHVRRSSSFWISLEALNQDFHSRGLEPIRIVPAHEYLETEDLLEMTGSGLIPMTVADTPLARFWADVVPGLEVREDLKLAEKRRIGWAIRKDAAGLKPVIDAWVAENREGRLLGNLLLKRYLRENRWVRNPSSKQDQERLHAMIDLFRRYGEQYDVDWLLVAAQGYQESGLDQSKRSAAGAIGVMQVLPSTARDPAVGISDIEQLEPNVHAGVRYLRHIVDSYFNDPGIDPENRLLFAFASYNAGPTRIRRLRREAARQGLDPNQWFRNVELVVAEQIGRETVQYVTNIYKYYVAFDLLLADERGRGEVRAALE
jgi:membrane-bound lytic murein transglycosylase MltF